MELKNYQKRVLSTVQEFLKALADEQAEGNIRHAAMDAWEKVTRRRFYRERRTGAGRDLPTFTIKVPTGGGKTLLATQILGEAHRLLLPERGGTGLALWVVPSDQIYRDTLKALRDRDHLYRRSLEFALSRRLEVWEKHEIARLTPAQLSSALNVLIVKLQGTNRLDKESLKFFRDSGGNIVQHFPDEDDADGHRALKKRIPNLEMLEDDPATGRHLAKTSISNLVRLCEPVVILDEGHKATSDTARATVEGFNPRLVVELSATPPDDANQLVTVTGQELLDEEMIKLPINVANSRQLSWQNCITQAREKRELLAAKAREHYHDSQRLIRPIVLVQVERTGKDQRTPDFIHSEDVREYLVQRLGVSSESVRVKSSERDDIEGVDLLADGCPVEWIITKSALQEGWDCPFAYILVSLNNTKSRLSMTQLVGRVLRQPYQQRTPFPELNESYVYCLREAAADVVSEIRKALTKEGYQGEASSVVDRSGDGGETPSSRTARIRPEISQLYGQPRVGRVLLPRFTLRVGDRYQPLDYFRHLLRHVAVGDFDYSATSAWDLSHDLARAKEHFLRVNISEEALTQWDVREEDLTASESDAATRAWLVANLDMPWHGPRQLRHVVKEVCDRLPQVEGQLSLVRFPVLERLRAFITRETDRQTEARFRQYHADQQLFFYVQSAECTFEIPASVVRQRIKAMSRDDGSPLQRNLFDFHPDDDNPFERDVALMLDALPEVKWWYRNLVGSDDYSIQGYRRERIRPDYALMHYKEGESPVLHIVESKGRHLKGNMDTEYKRDVASYFNDLGRRVTWQEMEGNGDVHSFRFEVLDQGDYSDQEWRDALAQMFSLGSTNRTSI